MPVSIHAFAEKVALVTDGENPLGRAVALQLALQGAYVIVGHSNSSAENARAIAELQSLGTLASAVQADIATPEGARLLVGEVGRAFGRLDLLVNCLKFTDDSAFENNGEELYGKVVDAHLKAAFFVTQEALSLMRPRPKPKVVNLVSALDTPETAGNPLLAAANGALIGLTEALARSLPKNFRVNAVAVSEKYKKNEALDPELFRAKRGVSEDDVARAVLFLLSSEAVGLNGQTLKVE